MTGLIMQLLFRGRELWDFGLRKDLMGQTSRNMKDSVAESNIDYDGLAEEVLE